MSWLFSMSFQVKFDVEVPPMGRRFKDEIVALIVQLRSEIRSQRSHILKRLAGESASGG